MQVIRHLQQDSLRVSACKIDCLETSDDARYRSLGIPVCIGLSDYLCPDHFYVANLEEVRDWAENQKTDVLILETAGLCHRCAPAVQGCLTVQSDPVERRAGQSTYGGGCGAYQQCARSAD